MASVATSLLSYSLASTELMRLRRQKKYLVKVRNLKIILVIHKKFHILIHDFRHRKYMKENGIDENNYTIEMQN